jgi:hypothetical protein
LSTRPLILGAALALLSAAAWVALTAVTGKTYHVAPLVVAAAPGWVLRWWHEAEGRELPSGASALTSVLVAVIGAASVAAGSLAILATGTHLSATIIPDQPGGVVGETVFFSALGLFVSARSVARAGCARGMRGSAPDRG